MGRLVWALAGEKAMQQFGTEPNIDRLSILGLARPDAFASLERWLKENRNRVVGALDATDASRHPYYRFLISRRVLLPTSSNHSGVRFEPCRMFLSDGEWPLPLWARLLLKNLCGLARPSVCAARARLITGAEMLGEYYAAEMAASCVDESDALGVARLLNSERAWA